MSKENWKVQLWEDVLLHPALEDSRKSLCEYDDHAYLYRSAWKASLKERREAHRMEYKECRFQASPSTYAATIENRIVLLDLQHDTFLGLNQTAASIWNLLVTGKTPLEVAQLWSKGDTVDSHIMKDVTTFVEYACSKQLLILSNSDVPYDGSMLDQARTLRSAQTRPLFFQIASQFCRIVPGDFLEAYVTLFHIQQMLEREGFLRLVKQVNLLPAQTCVTAEDKQVQRLAHAIKVAADWHRFPAVCLHQSLALYWILRRRAIQADVVIGVYTHPFSAHVWVGCHDDVLLWEAGMGAYPDKTRLAAMAVVFHSGRLVPAGGKSA